MMIQLRKRKTLKKSLNFTVMVVGQSGSGRSTFINSMCDQLIVESSSTVALYTPEELIYPERELQLRKSNVELEDNEGMKINLNLIDTPGFGDSINNSVSFKVIKDYIKYQFDEILVEESRLRRNPRFKDGRIHVCLYFITPTGHGLREMDIEMIRQLGEYVNILPCISKSDSLTIEELKLNKKLIREDIEHYKLPIFDFNSEYFSYDDNLDDESMELNKYLQKTIPFAVMGSNSTTKDAVTGEVKRIRKYPWGSVDIFDNEISDVPTLKDTLLVTHLNELKDFTHEVLYENYRTRTLADASGPVGSGDADDDYTNDQSYAHGSDSTDVMQTRQFSSHDNQSVINSNEADIAAQADYKAKEEQIRKEEERLRAFEERVQNDLLLKREEIEARERELAELERRLAEQGLN